MPRIEAAVPCIDTHVPRSEAAVPRIEAAVRRVDMHAPRIGAAVPLVKVAVAPMARDVPQKRLTPRETPLT